jgi:polar amino acid transport system permease protein
MLGMAITAGLPELADGLVVTLLLTLAGSVISLAVGVSIAAVRLGGGRFAVALALIYVSFMRGTPALVQLFLVFFGLPILGLGGHPFAAAASAIGLNSAAYVSEVLRAAILAVPPGQREAADAIGLSGLSYWHRILLPQALAIALPGLTNEATLLLKTTPLASAVAVTELTFSGQMIIARTYEAARVLTLVSLGYLLLCLVITRCSAALGHHLRAKI